MSTPHESGPAPTATRVPLDTPRGLRAGPVVTALVGVLAMVGGLALGGAWTVAFPVGLLVALMGIGLIRYQRAHRNDPVWVVSLDATGLWLNNGLGQNVIAWDTLAGVGLHWRRGNGSAKYTLELCPVGPIDRDDPVLWLMVRDDEPLRPGLPRLRYRLGAGGDCRESMAEAVQRYAPHLWFGEIERERNYGGLPDTRGHLERTGGRTR